MASWVKGRSILERFLITVQLAIIFSRLVMPGSDTKNLTEVEKWKIYAEICKWTDQKIEKIVNNGIERVIEYRGSQNWEDTRQSQICEEN